MTYRENRKNGDRLPVLGFGCMRFPKDEKETEKLVLCAIEKGINFFDTAYVYGNTEETLGRILARNNKRREVLISTKIPPALIKKYEDFDKYFARQLGRLQTDYVDYYFIHMITDERVWARLAGLGAVKWIEEKKAQGKIKNIGFSYHGGKDEFVKICDAYPWDFTMIQYNYLDEHNQAGRSGLHHAAKNMPVFIMEPLRGGILANKLPKRVQEVFNRAHIKRSPAEWSFRWIWDQPETSVVLSGMNNMAVLEENLGLAQTAEAGSFTDEDFAVIAKAKQAFMESIKTPCTGCGYCMPCPRGVDIPTCLSCYNDTVIAGRLKAMSAYMMQTGFKRKPQVASLCNGCGACEPKCPQNIPIPKEIKHTARALEPFYVRPIGAIARRFMRLR